MLDLDHLFTYHAPTEQQLKSYNAIRNAFKGVATLIEEHLPEGDLRDQVVMKLHLANMEANRVVALEGRIYPLKPDPRFARGTHPSTKDVKPL